MLKDLINECGEFKDKVSLKLKNNSKSSNSILKKMQYLLNRMIKIKIF